MLTTLSVLAVLTAAPGEVSSLKIDNIRNTQGILGPTREDGPFLPGDSFVLAFDIKGLKEDPDGKVLYSTAVEVADSKGKVLFKQQPKDLEAVNALGGGTLPGYVKLDIGINQPGGEFTLKVTITDRATKKSQNLTRTALVLPPGYGLVRLNLATDPEGHSPAAALAAGQSLWLNAGVVGFERDKSTKQPNIRLTLRVLDEAGKPTVRKPFSGEVNKDVDSKAISIPAQFHLSLNRSGKFLVELEAADQVSGKTAKLSFPINVLSAK